MTHGLDTHKRLDRTVTGIRGRAASPQTAHAAEDRPAPIVAQLRRTVRPERDGARRVAAVVPLDGQHRAAVGKPVSSLGWDTSTRLVMRVTRDRAVVVEGTLSDPGLLPVKLDAQGRLQLPPAAVNGLELGPGEQVLVIAVPTTGELLVHAATDVLQDLTGRLETQAEDSDPAVSQAAVGHRRTSVGRAFRPQ